MNRTVLFQYCLHLADNALILAQRNSEWCGHGPVLEQDIAITNISLDLLGQARNYFQYAASLYNEFNKDEKEAVNGSIPRLWKIYDRQLTEDDLAFLRDEHQYLNLLLLELPRGDWAYTLLRQFFFSSFQFNLYSLLKQSSDTQLAAIAEKSITEVTYHLRWSSEWVVRLGNGTGESRQRMRNALDELWPYTVELFTPASYEIGAANEGFGVDVALLKDDWKKNVETVFAESLLLSPNGEELKRQFMQTGGKDGRHTEHLGYILAEMQYLQRAFPNSEW